MLKDLNNLNSAETNTYFNETLETLSAITLRNIRQKIDDPTLSEVVSMIINARRIFGLGGGNSGDFLQILIRRLMHIGFEAYMVGETTTPAANNEDLLIVASGSAEYNFEKIKETGIQILLFTSNIEVKGLEESDLVVIIQDRRLKGKNISSNNIVGVEKIAPMGTIFETSFCLYVLALIALLMKKTGKREGEMENMHANIKF